MFEFEIIIYFFVWCLSVAYSVYCFSFATFKYFSHYKDEYGDFAEGIFFLSDKRDKADIEWEGIMYLVEKYFPYMLIYISIAQVFKFFNQIKIFKLWHVVFSLLYILTKWNYTFLIFLLIQPVFFQITTTLYPHKLCVWISSSVSLVLLNYFKWIVNDPEILKSFQLKDYELYILVCSLFWMNLKCTSFSLEKTEETDPLSFFSYCLYPPTLFSGPFVLYKDFKCSYDAKIPFSLQKCKKMFKNMGKLLFWYSFVYVSLHFVYVNAAGFHPQFIENLDSWSLYGYGYMMGQFFHLKYVIVYGMSTSISALENINVPNLPRCIGRIHLYSDMWKYFDPGLYNFLIKNIYLPMMEVTNNKPIRSFICFFFVYIWHGLEQHILLWTTMNYLGILLENIIWPKHNKNGNIYKLDPQNWKRRKDCFVAAFLLIMSAISNFYFFSGCDVGLVFSKRLFTDISGNAFLIVALYCCCQVSTELRAVPASSFSY